jgi:hypothetical protein
MADTPEGWDTQLGNLSDQTNPTILRRLAIIKDMYSKIGLGELFDTLILEEVVRDPNQTSREVLKSNKIQDSEVYKKRFKANDARVASGLKPLDPVEYVQLEETYKQYMQQAGLPKGFYDNPDDFQDWIGKGVAATEVQGRVQMAADAYQTLEANDPGQLQALRDMYGIGRDGVMAYFLDPDKATPLLEKQNQLAASKIAGAGNNFGVSTAKAQAESLAAKGVTEQEARERYRGISAEADQVAKLGGIYGDGVSSEDQVTEAFGLSGANEVTKRKKKLASQERAAFSGSSGIAQGSLSQKKQAI